MSQNFKRFKKLCVLYVITTCFLYPWFVPSFFVIWWKPQGRVKPKTSFISFLLEENWLEEGGLSPAGLCYRWRTPPSFGWQTSRPRSASWWTVPPEWCKRIQRFNQDGRRSLILTFLCNYFNLLSQMAVKHLCCSLFHGHIWTPLVDFD